ncbi:MAG: WD40/YVTN/BNR-like repeat-containing protein [Ardenticatenaceae bacterium]
MDNTLLVATGQGLILGELNGGSWRERGRGLAGRQVTSVIAREGVILAGTTDGVFRSDDGGESWREVSQGLALRHVRWMAYHPDISDLEFVGTEPAGIFVSRDGAASWRACPEVAELRDEFGWYLPYSPEAGCVRGFAFHGRRAYAAVEVGGVLRSDDGGETWRLADGSTGIPSFDDVPERYVASDVHSVESHPSSPDLALAATHDGLFRSRDGGATWEHVYQDAYCRALWVDSRNADHIILGPSTPEGWHGRIEETRDGGRTWRAAASGFEIPPHTLVERFAQVDDELFAVLSDGQLIAAPLSTLEWRRILPQIVDAEAVAVLRG